jgi:CelD/BcsL family acetyltransferase involved in cellulose biosynthesis
MTLQVQRYRTTSSFGRLAGEWDALLRRSVSDTPFLTVEYQRVWWEHLGRGELAIIAVRDDSQLVGIAPLFVTTSGGGRRVLETIGCVEVSDYLDLIVEQGREEQVLGALLEYLADEDAPEWDAIELCNVPENSPSLKLVPALATDRGWSVSISREDVCPIVRLPATWEEYLAGLRGKDRREIRRKLRRAEGEYQASWYIAGPERELKREVEEFLRLMAASSPEKEAFLTERMRGFFQALAKAAAERGWLQLAFLEVGGRKAATYFNLVYNNRVLVYNSGLDWDAFPSLSAGHVLIAYCIRQAIEDGRQVFDFLRGDERYKYRFGGVDFEVRRLVVRRQAG